MPRGSRLIGRYQPRVDSLDERCLLSTLAPAATPPAARAGATGDMIVSPNPFNSGNHSPAPLGANNGSGDGASNSNGNGNGSRATPRPPAPPEHNSPSNADSSQNGDSNSNPDGASQSASAAPAVAAASTTTATASTSFASPAIAFASPSGRASPATTGRASNEIGNGSAFPGVSANPSGVLVPSQNLTAGGSPTISPGPYSILSVTDTTPGGAPGGGSGNLRVANGLPSNSAGDPPAQSAATNPRGAGPLGPLAAIAEARWTTRQSAAKVPLRGPSGVGLITELLPFDRLSLEETVARFLDRFSEVGTALEEEADHLPTWFLVLSSGIALELTRRLHRRLGDGQSGDGQNAQAPTLHGLS